MKTAILLIFLAVATVSGDDDHSRTGGFINGRAWRTMADAEKVGYVMGVGDGIRLALQTRVDDKAPSLCPDPAACIKRYFGRSTYGEIEGALDDFYRDPANVQIPVGTAMYYFQDKVNGKSPESLAEELASFRRLSAAMQ